MMLVTQNKLRSATLTLFVLNDNSQIVGTLTDGDIRRALVNGYDWLYAWQGDALWFQIYQAGRVYRSQLEVVPYDRRIMFIPILDAKNHVVDVVNLKFRSKLPIDAVLMAGGKVSGFIRLLRRYQTPSRSGWQVHHRP